jgi:hypothetical protein
MKKAAIILFLLPVLSFAQADADSVFIKKMSDDILRNGKAHDLLRQLTKQVGGRLAGSPQSARAVSWGKFTMEMVAPDKVFLQQCMVPHWVRGGTDLATIVEIDKKPFPKKLDVLALGNSIGSGPKGVTAQVVEVKSFEELELKKEQVKGKIVFYNYPFNATFVRTFQAYGDANKYRGQGPSQAAKYGAVGTIVRSMSHGANNHPHTGSTRYDSLYAKIPAVAIGLEHADQLSQWLQKQVVQVKLETHGYFLPDTIGHNIIGELKGTEFPDQIITVGGHLDSWDNCEGAHDDGAGCVQTIEILRAFKAIGYQPRHTIRFVLFANEENGLRGGTQYAAEAKEKNEQHIFALESDAGGFTPRGFGFTMSEAQYQRVLGWQSLIAPYGCSEFSKGGGGADIGPLNKAFNTPVAGLQPDSQRYFDYHHARNDVFEAVNKRELELGAVNMAALLYLVDRYGLGQ